jgi:hypothetical protein
MTSAAMEGEDERIAKDSEGLTLAGMSTLMESLIATAETLPGAVEVAIEEGEMKSLAFLS